MSASRPAELSSAARPEVVTSKSSVGAGISVEAEAMRQLGAAFRREADGKALRRDLTKQIGTAVAPAVSAVQGVLRAIPHPSAAHASPRLSTYLSSRVKVQVRYSGRSTGVRVRIGETPNLRGFTLAARYLNKKSWRHPVFGNREVWVTQTSPVPGYWDDTLAADRDKYRDAVVDALGMMARRLMERHR